MSDYGIFKIGTKVINSRGEIGLLVGIDTSGFMPRFLVEFQSDNKQYVSYCDIKPC